MKPHSKDPSRPYPAIVLGLIALVSLVVWRGTLPLSAAGTQPPYLYGFLRDAVRSPSTYIDARMLSAGVAKSVTVPTFSDPGALVVVIFSPKSTCSDYYASVNGTAVEPTVDVSDGSASERNPNAWQLRQGTTISLESPTSCAITLIWELKTSI